MIEVHNLQKSYRTGSFEQHVLKGVSIAFRDNEFVAVLGPSGSGKTTLLNILGGLDRSDAGEIVINGTSTKKYKSADWDTYRNHRIGFVFQSYNLIPHQSVRSNVELALTLSGVGKSERRERALKALEAVGLKEHAHKKPSQLSGGQMQRVAIARALVNDPDIVLADEPTGALDTETGVQIMDLLSEVAKDRLVIMVTHNPELAETYATRIVRLSDGLIVDDTNPLPIHESTETTNAYEEARALTRERDKRIAREAAEQTDKTSRRAKDLPAAPPVESFERAREGFAQGKKKAAAAAESGAAAEAGTTAAAAGAEAAAATAAHTEDTASTSVTAADSSIAPVASTVTVASAPASTTEPTDSAASTNGRIGDTPNRKKKRASMSFLTALSLSFNNLMTKKGRTFMTAFAGSIGIIGIAAILALSNGVNDYINRTQEEALASYPLTISKTSFDFTSMMGMSSNDASGAQNADAAETSKTENGSFDASAKVPQKSVVKDQFEAVSNNDLGTFKKFLESDRDELDPYVNTITYGYGIQPWAFRTIDDKLTQVNPASSSSVGGMDSFSSNSSMTATFGSMSSFNEMLDDTSVLEKQYELVEGSWAKDADEVMIVLNSEGGLSDMTLYNLGILNQDELTEALTKFYNDEKVDFEVPDANISYEDLLNMKFDFVSPALLYQKNTDSNTWTDKKDDKEFVQSVLDEHGISVHVAGIIKPRETSAPQSLNTGVAYTNALTRELMKQSQDAPIVQEQLANKDTDVITGKTFKELKEGQNDFDMSKLFTVDEEAMQNAFKIDESAIAFDPSSLDFSGLSSAIDPDMFAKALANAPAPDAKSMPKMDLSMLNEKQLVELQKSMESVANGFLPWWYKEHPGQTITDDMDLSKDYEKYLQTEPVKKQLAAISQMVGEASAKAMTDSMQTYMQDVYAPYMEKVMAQMSAQMGAAIQKTVSEQMTAAMTQLSAGMQNAFSFDQNAFQNAFKFNMTEDDLKSLFSTFAQGNTVTYDANMKKFGYATEDSPDTISIYPKDFKSKDEVLAVIDRYNKEKTDAGEDAQVIHYSDLVGSLMTSVTDIVNMVSYVLIAFVSISLVVSSIMIGIITYISVLERKKEIGILRAMGASKRNIANVFNAETIIEGLIAGVFAVAVVLGVSVPVNAIVAEMFNVTGVMNLPWVAALVLVGISVFLTFIAGLIPSQAASRRDPVEALRSE